MAPIFTEENLSQLKDLVEYGDQDQLQQSHSYPKAKDYVSTKFHLLVDTCTFELLEARVRDSTSIVMGLLSTFSLSFERKPNVEGYSLFSLLQRFEVSDTRRQGALFPYIVAPKKKGFRDNQASQGNVDDPPFFSLLYEKHPIASTSDTKVTCCMQPLDIVYSRDLVVRILQVFWEQASDPLLQSLQSAALGQLESLKNKTTKRLEDVLKSKEVLDIELDLHAPRIIVPMGTGQQAQLMVFDLGHLTFRNEGGPNAHPHQLPDFSQHLLKGDGDDEEEDADEFFDVPSEVQESTLEVAAAEKPPARFYDNYVMKLSSVQALSCRSNTDWRDTRLQKEVGDFYSHRSLF